jgi:hypothetical protein
MALGNQTLGRGKIYFSLFKDGTQTPEGFRYIGNTPSFSLNITNDTLDHYSSDEGVKEKDKSIVLQTTSTGTLTCDDIQPENLALFFFGSSDVLSQASATAATYPITGVKQGLMYQIGATDDNPTGVRSISTVIVAHTSTTYVLNTDYTVDLDLGLLTIVEGGSITDASDITVTYDQAAKSRQVIISGSTQIQGALKYVADNPEGDDIDYLMPYVRLSPNGDYALKGDDWLALALSVEILKLSNRERIYMDGRAFTPS